MPRFYAELLQNIRSVTLSVRLPDPAAPDSAIACHSDACLVLRHHGRCTPLILPAPVDHAAPLPAPRCGETTLSYRLPLARSVFPPPPTENHVPWSAPSLSPPDRIAISCRACRAELVKEGVITTWKDLPSGNWADMMDFWHCHKPEEPPAGAAKTADNNQAAGKYSSFGKGYAATPGTALVDLTYFLVAAEDCVDVEVIEDNNPTATKETPLHCNSCHTPLGILEEEGEPRNNRRLNKYALTLSISGIPQETASIELFVTAGLLGKCESEATRRFFVTTSASGSGAGAGDGLMLWFFNTDIKYTSTTYPTAPIRAVKVFYKITQPTPTTTTTPKKQKNQEVEGEGSLKANAVETIVFDKQVFEILKIALERSTVELIDGGGNGRFEEWEVGSLRRF